MDDTVQSDVISHCAEEGYAGRVDVVTDPSGRRRWPEDVKAEIVLESYRDGCSVADIARKHGVSGPQLHAWRRAAREGVLAMPGDDMLGLVPVVVEASGGGDDGNHPTDPPGTILMEVEGVRVIVPPGFDSDHLGRVIAAVRASA
ncbi:MAG: transposase [Paracoccaceae bacterium]